MKHELKTVQPWYGLVSSGVKQFELRYNDRNYRTGDTLLLKEWVNDESRFTGNEIKKTVYAVYDNVPGLKEGYVLLFLDKDSFDADAYVEEYVDIACLPEEYVRQEKWKGKTLEQIKGDVDFYRPAEMGDGW